MTSRTLRSVLALVFIASLDPALAAGPQLRFAAAAGADSTGAALTGPRAVACRSGKAAVADADGRVVLYESDGKSLAARREWRVREAAQPSALAFGPGDDLSILSVLDGRIVRVSADGTVGAVLRVPSEADGSPVVPRSLAVDPEGRILVLDVGSEAVRVLGADGRFLVSVPLPPGRSYSDLAVADDGSVLVSAASDPHVLRVSLQRRDASRLGDAPGPEAAEMPTAVAAGPPGSIFVLDRSLGAIWSLRGDGSVADRLLEHGWNEGQLRDPVDLCFDGEGLVFVADRDNRRVQLFRVVE